MVRNEKKIKFARMIESSVTLWTGLSQRKVKMYNRNNTIIHFRMKQTFRLLMLVLPLLLTACINDDSATQGGTTQLVGRWTVDVTVATQTLWGDGKALRTTELASDGVPRKQTFILISAD